MKIINSHRNKTKHKNITILIFKKGLYVNPFIISIIYYFYILGVSCTLKANNLKTNHETLNKSSDNTVIRYLESNKNQQILSNDNFKNNVFNINSRLFSNPEMTEINNFSDSGKRRELSVSTLKTYKDPNEFLTTFKSETLTTKGFQTINGISVLLDETILVTSYIKNDYLVLEAFDIESNFNSIASYSHTEVSFKSSILNSKIYIASSSVCYLDNGEFMMYYTKEYQTNKYGLYSNFIKFNTVSRTFTSSSYSSYNNVLISPMARSGSSLANISFLYTSVVNFTYNCISGNDAISVLTVSHYK